MSKAKLKERHSPLPHLLLVANKKGVEKNFYKSIDKQHENVYNNKAL